MRCSAERPRRPNTSRSPRTRRTCLSGVMRRQRRALRPSAAPARCGRAGRRPRRGRRVGQLDRPVVVEGVDGLGRDRRARPCRSSRSSRRRGACGTRRTSRPTEAALTRSGMSLVTRVTFLPSAAMFSATARMRESLLSTRKPAGSVDRSEWLSSTCSVPPWSPIGTGASRRPWVMRSSSSTRSVCRANQPSSGWWRLPSSSLMTTSGRTTSCSAKRPSAPGSESRTDVSRTNVRRPVGRVRAGCCGQLGHLGHVALLTGSRRRGAHALGAVGVSARPA